MEWEFLVFQLSVILLIECNIVKQKSNDALKRCNFCFRKKSKKFLYFNYYLKKNRSNSTEDYINYPMFFSHSCFVSYVRIIRIFHLEKKLSMEFNGALISVTICEL
jgi:hypothetical protein